ncbi:unnamed protein product [Tuber aestivum]|uniref:BTB domain-containing protein n=1 Tax=Tuber aestivum TaxID=59557 RepID=A0A292PZY8_9PEZI|nr:unnamed protein product [Tuber aestivum]
MAENEVKDLPLRSCGRVAAFSSAIFQINVEKGARTFYVHGDILSRSSRSFKSIVEGDWKESTNRRIDLEDWDADTVGRTIDYLYTGDYTWEKDGNFTPIPIEVPEEFPTVDHSFRAARPLTPLSGLAKYRSTSYLSYSDSTVFLAYEGARFGELLLMHAKVYALASCWAIGKLSELALDRLLCTLRAFQATEYDLQQIRYIVELVSYVYENTCLRVGEHEPMRRVVTRFTALELTKLNAQGEISKLMDAYGDFACDLLSDVTRSLKLAEVSGGLQHKYLAGIEVSQSGYAEGDISPPAASLVLELILVNERYTRGGHSHQIACKRVSGEARTSISGRKLSESAPGSSRAGTGPIANARELPIGQCG